MAIPKLLLSIAVLSLTTLVFASDVYFEERFDGMCAVPLRFLHFDFELMDRLALCVFLFLDLIVLAEFCSEYFRKFFSSVPFGGI